jgi:hypothetical protein
MTCVTADAASPPRAARARGTGVRGGALRRGAWLRRHRSPARGPRGPGPGRPLAVALRRPRRQAVRARGGARSLSSHGKARANGLMRLCRSCVVSPLLSPRARASQEVDSDDDFNEERDARNGAARPGSEGGKQLLDAAAASVTAAKVARYAAAATSAATSAETAAAAAALATAAAAERAAAGAQQAGNCCAVHRTGGRGEGMRDVAIAPDPVCMPWRGVYRLAPFWCHGGGGRGALCQTWPLL